MGCTDCPRGCQARGAASYCGVDRPGRVLWHGVTYAEEEVIAPTYEVFLTGCSLRCRFCFVPDALYAPREAPWMSPEELVSHLTADTTPPWRALSFVGGDPTVNLPWLREVTPRVRQALPGRDLVLNTNLYSSPALAGFYASSFDWIVGDLHFWRPECAREVAGAADYPEVGRANAEAMLAAGARLILRILVLPGHLECCARPTAEWARTLRGEVEVRVMSHYAPAGRARGHAQLGRPLSEEELILAARLPARPGPWPAPPPLPLPAQPCEAPAILEVDASGALLIPFVTGALLPLAAAHSPWLRPRLLWLAAASEDAPGEL